MKRFILFSAFFLFNLFFANATNYTWVGHDSVYITATNWSPSGVPGSMDSIIVGAGSSKLALAQNQDVYCIRMMSGSVIDLKTYSLTIQNQAIMDAGSMGNGTLIIRGASAKFNGSTFNCILDIVSGIIELNGGSLMIHVILKLMAIAIV